MHLFDVDSAPICAMCAALQVEVGVAREPTYKCALFGATSALVSSPDPTYERGWGLGTRLHLLSVYTC